MAKARKQRLKVYRTPIGFHDAYVAAPSQKAALEAWGAGTNLFAQGAAEVVTDPALTKVPLEHPGKVVKVLRGDKAEQLAALDRAERGRPAANENAPAKQRRKAKIELPKPRGPKPSRSRLTKAEEALDALEKRQEKETQWIEKQQEALRRRREELDRRQSDELRQRRENIEREREKYQRLLRLWENG